MSLPIRQSVRFMQVESFKPIVRSSDAPEDEPNRYEVAASSEYPIKRMNWWTGKEYNEVLDHSPESIDLSRFNSGRASLLEEHRGAPIGVIESARVDADKKLRVVVRFSRAQRAREVEQDIKDGIRSNCSIGYVVCQVKVEETKLDGPDTYRAVRWEPMELSIVGVPADPTVGLNRAAEENFAPAEVVGAATEETRKMEPVKVNDTAAQERERVASIHETVNSARQLVGNALDDKVGGWLRDGSSVEAVQRAVLAAISTRGAATLGADPLAAVPARDLRHYSYARAILGATQMKEGKRADGLEAEVSEELAKSQPSKRDGLLMPMTTRTLAANAGTKGAEIVFEQAGDLIELLRNKTALIQLGAMSLTGLTAPIAFPKQTGAMSAYWVGENPGTNVAASDVALALAMLNPKTLQGTTAYSRQLLATASIDVESMVRNELALIHALAIDYAGIHGLSAAGEPQGVYAALNVSATAVGGATAYSHVLDAQGKVALLNADMGALGWLMNPKMATNLKGIAMFTNTATPVWTGPYSDGQVGGYKSIATNQVSKTMTGSARVGGSEIGAVFGNFNDVIIGMWGALELVVDPYSQKKQGLIEVTSFQLADVLIRRGESFTKFTGATA